MSKGIRQWEEQLSAAPAKLLTVEARLGLCRSVARALLGNHSEALYSSSEADARRWFDRVTVALDQFSNGRAVDHDGKAVAPEAAEDFFRDALLDYTRLANEFGLPPTYGLPSPA
jgi:hypothetical protein